MPRTATTTPRKLLYDAGTSLSFDGVDDKVVIAPNSSQDATTAVSINFWYKGVAGDTTSRGVILNKGNSGAGDTYSYRVEIRRSSQSINWGFWTDVGERYDEFVLGRNLLEEWANYTLTIDSSGYARVYRNGTLLKTSSQRLGTLKQRADENLCINGLSTYWLKGAIEGLRLYKDVVLTPTEISNLHYNNIVPQSGLVGEWKFNEGSGTTAYDTSGNGNHGTITGATWSSDKPSQLRKLVDANLVENGDFEFAPPFVAEQTGNSRWLDGTAAGSSVRIFGWGVEGSGTFSAKFDSSVKHGGDYSMKLSTKDVNSSFVVGNWYSSATDDPKTAYYFAEVLPSTEYVFSFWMKTNLVSGDATNGAYVEFRERRNNRSTSKINESTKVKTTTDWTHYSYTFTTNSNSRYLQIRNYIDGNDGTGTLIMDAWFDDIVLKPTTPVTRTLTE